MARILVVGATGLIGAPVARRLLAGGPQMRLLVGDTGPANELPGGPATTVKARCRSQVPGSRRTGP